MLVRSPLVAACLLAALPPAQERKHIGYPERDILSPFRDPAEVYAPPDEVFRLLRIMQSVAGRRGTSISYDGEGREVVDDPAWREAKAQLDHVQVDAGYLAQIMRLHKNGTERATAFYGAFYVRDVDHVFNLISHIPGEPVRSTREAAMPRAVQFLRAHLGRRFGSLSPEQRQAIVEAMPEVGSPAARSRGIGRLPTDEDHLHSLRLVPFFQLLDLDDPLDQAQALWFLKEVFMIRGDLVSLWLEPVLPRLRQLLGDGSKQGGARDGKVVRDQVVELIQTVGPKDLRPPPMDDARELVAWVDEAMKVVFPPIRNLNNAIVQIFPSPERDALAAAATKALETSSLGEPFFGKQKDGTSYRGLRIGTVPDELRALAIPDQAVITAVNGVAILDAKSLLATVREQLRVLPYPRQLFVEYVQNGEARAVEYRLM